MQEARASTPVAPAKFFDLSSPPAQMALPISLSLIANFTPTARVLLVVYPIVRACSSLCFNVAITVFYRESRQDVYNILWAVVFGFATLNIISLAARRLEPNRRGMTFGELVAVMVVLLSIVLLGWEMLNTFHIFPLKLRP
jgi:uncharacterized membrane protein